MKSVLALMIEMFERHTKGIAVAFVMGLVVATVSFVAPQSSAAYAAPLKSPQSLCSIDPKTVGGYIGEYYRGYRGGFGDFGCPVTTKEQDWQGGRIRFFQKGTILWVPFPDGSALMLSVVQFSETDLRFFWQDPGHRDGYYVAWTRPDSDWKVSTYGPRDEYQINNARPGTEYSFQINGCNDRVCHGWSPSVVYTTYPK